MHSKRGFSLIGLLIGLFVVVMLIGVSVLVFSGGAANSYEVITPSKSSTGTSSSGKKKFDPISDSLKTGRDSSRKMDLDTVKMALQIALADGSINLTETTNCASCRSTFGNTRVDDPSAWVVYDIKPGSKGLSLYISKLPIDPAHEERMFYQYGSDGENFELNAVLESDSGLKDMRTDKGNNPDRYEVGTDLTILP